MCRDLCTSGKLPPKLNIISFSFVDIGNHQRVHVHTLPKGIRDELYEALVMAWEQAVSTNLGLCMLGPEVVCGDIICEKGRTYKMCR